MYLFLQPEDFVIATGEMHSVREFVEAAFRHVGKEIEWEGEAEKVGDPFSPWLKLNSWRHKSVMLENKMNGKVKLNNKLTRFILGFRDVIIFKLYFVK